MSDAGFSARAAAAWDRFWFAPASLVRLGVFRIIVLLAALYAVWVFRIGVFQHADPAGGAELVDRAWRPIFAFEVLGLGPPDLQTVRVVFGVLLAALLCGIVGLFTRPACAVVAVLATWWIGVHYSFGKPHHDCIALTFALWALPFAPVGARISLDARFGRRAPPEDASPAARFPIRIAQLSAALGYMFAGGSKLGIGGIEWLNGYSLQAAMLHFHAPWTEFFTASPRMCQLMSIQIVFVQTTFLLALIPRARWFYVPMAVFFHLMSWMTMSTGPYLTLWFVVLAAFVPWERVPSFVNDHGPVRRLALGTAIVALGGWFAWIYLAQAPPRAEHFLLGMALWAILYGVWRRREPAAAQA